VCAVAKRVLVQKNGVLQGGKGGWRTLRRETFVLQGSRGERIVEKQRGLVSYMRVRKKNLEGVGEYQASFHIRGRGGVMVR